MKAALIALALLALVSCQSAPPPLAPDAPSAIYFQRAQAASDQNDYTQAMEIYRSFLANRPDASNEDKFSARYEIALLLDKEDKKAESLADFQAILTDYDDLTKSQGAPAWVKILSQKKIVDLKDKLAKSQPAVSTPAATPAADKAQPAS